MISRPGCPLRPSPETRCTASERLDGQSPANSAGKQGASHQDICRMCKHPLCAMLSLGHLAAAVYFGRDCDLEVRLPNSQQHHLR